MHRQHDNVARHMLHDGVCMFRDNAGLQLTVSDGGAYCHEPEHNNFVSAGVQHGAQALCLADGVQPVS